MREADGDTRAKGTAVLCNVGDGELLNCCVIQILSTKYQAYIGLIACYASLSTNQIASYVSQTRSHKLSVSQTTGTGGQCHSGIF
jgi:hypothetical protein